MGHSCLRSLKLKLQLEVLELGVLKYGSNELFQKLISSCPVLYSLTIYRDYADGLTVCDITSSSLRFLQITDGFLCDDTDQLKICAPALEHLLFKHHGICEISMEGLHSLMTVELDLNCVDCDDIDLCDLLVDQVIQAVNRAMVMKFYHSTMETLNGSLAELSVPFDRLTELYIEYDFCDWGRLEDLLHWFMKLRVLHIEKFEDISRCHWTDPTRVPDCLKLNLQHVSFIGFEGSNRVEYELIRYILEHGSVLERIQLRGDPSESEKRLLMHQKISMFRKASQSCQIEIS
ncbi:OLC1v1013761C1 [Oldenlandia corymbosa var. corymbosa]|uniref:OLC1v1013761C1 n=1 Tax=Oldenlandia corymbosa var. corymbosa TaxID=529605 RepID=A0AAV1DZ27_OLDCO|nr:OLC1v1013761C1 [Oldenlandia corymbosa var. corymbosa]